MLDEAMAWWYHAASFLYITGLALALGAAAAPLIFGRPVRAVLPAASFLLLTGVVARLMAQVQMAFGAAGGLTPTSIRVVAFDTPWGWGWRWQLASAALLLVQALRRSRTDRAGSFALALALAAAVTAGLTGHAMAVPEYTWLMVPVHAAHVAGAGLWMGSLAVLLMSVPLLARSGSSPGGKREALAQAVSRFSTVALAAVTLVALSGMAAAAVHVASWSALVETAYGRALILKIGVFLLAGLCGAWNWKRVSPQLPARDEAAVALHRVGTLELSLGLVVLLLTSLLAALPMPAEGSIVEAE